MKHQLVLSRKDTKEIPKREEVAVGISRFGKQLLSPATEAPTSQKFRRPSENNRSNPVHEARGPTKFLTFKFLKNVVFNFSPIIWTR
ncbi:hypothetical protein H8B06_19070 [Sphingobacterium sp. DN00404]|uniref:Uncharacterized protein n=1 Tax=Sphingobacterium micropteri TaxID=2763501 RepID=A0ABR7YUN5_9SPHI|nr:hypothetical protein [Sphingobacterium micropteri]MBD1434931.1 hypothetical protein [Sphingobacterium micropteri]